MCVRLPVWEQSRPTGRTVRKEKAMHRTRALVTAAVATLVVAGTVVAADAASASDHDSDGRSGCRYGAGPVGTWNETVDPVGPPPPFVSLVQFHSDGTMVDAVSSTPLNPALAPLHPDGATSGLGSWTRDGDSFRFAFERFITSGGVNVIDQRIEGTMTVASDCMSTQGTAHVTFTRASDHSVLAQADVVTGGTRLMP